VSDVKARARERIDGARDELVELSHRIHATPEPMWEEQRSSAWTAEALGRGGFSVSPVDGLPTAFVARAGSGPLRIAICAEYDALPGLGHACGHNVIAASAVGAGMALADVADEAGLTVTVFGTPAEEGGGGKVEMLDRGLFDQEHVAMMVHPAPFDDPAPGMIAAQHLRFRFTGKEAHAAAAPERGVNAADALTIGQVAVGLLRQHVRRTDMMQGSSRTAGTHRTSCPPTPGRAISCGRRRSRTSRRWCRESCGASRRARSRRARRCPSSGSRHTRNCEPTPTWRPLWRRSAEAIGRDIEPAEVLVGRFGASTDFGNVSRRLPAIHALIGIESDGAGNHEPEFAAAFARPSADRAIIDGAVLLAWTALDAAGDVTIRPPLTG
jgi:metal-dependent amidase/aminoacylase/carboxypeptidase family protein